MTPRGFSADEVRARFDAALDDELTEEERAAFTAALAEDEQLRAEYERLRELLSATKQLASDVPAVDLLASVQHKLRARSGGKFYRDRFAERRAVQPGVSLVLIVSALFLLAALSWFAYSAGWLG
jgi:anti-sigma factor RsiW